MDFFDGAPESTEGYAVVWPVVAIPLLAVIPIVTLLAETENRLAAGRRSPLA